MNNQNENDSCNLHVNDICSHPSDLSSHSFASSSNMVSGQSLNPNAPPFDPYASTFTPNAPNHMINNISLPHPPSYPSQPMQQQLTSIDITLLNLSYQMHVQLSTLFTTTQIYQQPMQIMQPISTGSLVPNTTISNPDSTTSEEKLNQPVSVQGLLVSNEQNESERLNVNLEPDESKSTEFADEKTIHSSNVFDIYRERPRHRRRQLNTLYQQLFTNNPSLHSWLNSLETSDETGKKLQRKILLKAAKMLNNPNSVERRQIIKIYDEKKSLKKCECTNFPPVNIRILTLKRCDIPIKMCECGKSGIICNMQDYAFLSLEVKFFKHNKDLDNEFNSRRKKDYVFQFHLKKEMIYFKMQGKMLDKYLQQWMMKRRKIDKCIQCLFGANTYALPNEFVAGVLDYCEYKKRTSMTQRAQYIISCGTWLLNDWWNQSALSRTTVESYRNHYSATAQLFFEYGMRHFYRIRRALTPDYFSFFKLMTNEATGTLALVSPGSSKYLAGKLWDMLQDMAYYCRHKLSNPAFGNIENIYEFQEIINEYYYSVEEDEVKEEDDVKEEETNKPN